MADVDFDAPTRYTKGGRSVPDLDLDTDPDYLPQDQRQRLAIARTLKAAIPEIDVYDLIRLGLWICTGEDPDSELKHAEADEVSR